MILVKALIVASPNASQRTVDRINRRNDRLARNEAARIAQISRELNELYNGEDGHAFTTNSDAVRFQFNIIPLTVENTEGPSSVREQRIIADKYGITTGEWKLAPAAIITTKSKVTSQTNGVSIYLERPSDGSFSLFGHIPHEVGHTMMTRWLYSDEEGAPGKGVL